MWSLFEDEKPLEPLVFSNGKTQADIVQEVIDAIKEGYKIIFIKGKCGTGKSSIALNLARKLGKTSIVVPVKSLQEQYLKDYSEKKYVMRQEKKLKICSIIGRQNFKCRFLKENNLLFENDSKIKEKDAKLTEIFQEKPINKIFPNKNFSNKNESCDNDFIPCKIELKEKNTDIIKDYLKNSGIDISEFDFISDIGRMNIAQACPYWSPIVSDLFEIKRFKNANKIKYKGLNNKTFAIYQRKIGCPYYDQYCSYADADVIIFNSLKYEIENLMDRKPETELEIIDECDEFLDSFAVEEQININKLSYALNSIRTKNEKTKAVIDRIIDLANAVKVSKKYSENEIFSLEGTLVEEILETLLINSEIIDLIDADEHNYLSHLDRVARTFENFFNETFFSIEKNENNQKINLVTINIEKRMKELFSKNKIFVLMSGTIHSQNVLKNIFGLDKFKIINAETENQGELIKRRCGYEIECSYGNFKNKRITREQYLKALSNCIKCAKKPILIHVTAFSDLPNEKEKLAYNLDNLISQEELIKNQETDPLGKNIIDFKNKKIDILFTTKCKRGMDFPGDICNSIIITRFPYPDISSIFWRIFKKTRPEHFSSFYMDRAKRELFQRIYRGLRSKNDKVYLLSPDSRVLDFEIE